MFESTQSREVSGKNTTNRYFSKQIILFRFYSKKRKKEKKKKRKEKKQRATVKRNRALEETERRKASLKCFMQIKITECTQVVQVYNIPGAHQTKALSAFCCCLFPLCPFISKKSPRKTFFFFPPPVFWISCFVLHNPDQSSTLTSSAV